MNPRFVIIQHEEDVNLLIPERYDIWRRDNADVYAEKVASTDDPNWAITICALLNGSAAS